jgi:hypothetical protein
MAMDSQCAQRYSTVSVLRHVGRRLGACSQSEGSGRGFFFGNLTSRSPGNVVFRQHTHGRPDHSDMSAFHTAGLASCEHLGMAGIERSYSVQVAPARALSAHTEQTTQARIPIALYLTRLIVRHVPYHQQPLQTVQKRILLAPGRDRSPARVDDAILLIPPSQGLLQRELPIERNRKLGHPIHTPHAGSVQCEFSHW